MLWPLATLVVIAALALVGYRLAGWWAGVPMGVIHQDGRVTLALPCRVMDVNGRCGGEGELSIGAGALQVWEAGRQLLDVPVGQVAGRVVARPRPSLVLTAPGVRLAVVVDRTRPVPVVVGPLGRRRQTTCAQVTIGALGEAVREGEFGFGDLSPYDEGANAEEANPEGGA
ncbi:MAG: hypothetical protein R2754_13825 [Microthrixaceae bacterium]